jgi:pilus assembly protein FimV
MIAFSACASVVLAALAGDAGAAELGEVTLHSFVGQPLVADIALTSLKPDELAGIQLRLASTDVYRGANVRIHPALASLRMTVMQDEQRPFIHLTTRQAIDADYLHLFLELNFGERRSVRAVTIWLSARPPTAPVAPIAPVAPVAPAAPTAPTALTALQVPTAPVAGSPAPEPARNRVVKPVPNPAPNPAPKPVSRSAVQSALNARQNRERLDREIREKAALEIEKEALRSKIAILEGKVAVLLQERVARVVLPPAPQAVAAPVVVVQVKGRAAFWIGGAAALLLALALVYRKNITGSRPWVALRQRLRRKAVAPAPAAPDEPDQAGPDDDEVADRKVAD